MIGEPWFWREESISARIVAMGLAPFALAYDAAQKTRRRMTRPFKAPVPVICVGNFTLGGAGKTPFAMMLQRLLRAKNYNAHFLTRGYGGALAGPLRVDPAKHNYVDVGDEALLLAAHGPTWVAKNRAAGARAAVKAGAGLIIMDDGFQNPTLHKDCSILLAPDISAFTNQRIFPAGPFREKQTDAEARADILVRVNAGEPAGDAQTGFQAWLEPAETPTPERIVAFCGVAKPDRFYEMLQELGFDVVSQISFPDHHPFTEKELKSLFDLAGNHKARLMTTQKDLARIPPEQRDEIAALAVAMRVNHAETFIEQVLKSAMPGRSS